MQCLQCLAAGRAAGSGAASPLLASLYCSSECFAKGHREHAQFHATAAKASSASDTVSWDAQLALLAEAPGRSGQQAGSSQLSLSDDDATVTAGSARAAAARGGVHASPLSSSPSYTPVWADVGHMLRLEVCASAGRQAPDAGGAAAHTLHRSSVLVGPVLAAPPLLRPPGWVLGPGVPAALLRVLARDPRASAAVAARRGAAAAIGGVEAARRSIALARDGGVRHWPGDASGSGSGGLPSSPLGGLVVRILSWNVLAELYAGPGTYAHCPAWALAWPFRVRAIVADILRYDADVVALQEVQSEHFDAVIGPAMAAAGYGALYKTKTREAAGTEGKVDGCAVFFRASAFSVASTFVIEFNDVADALIADERTRAGGGGTGARGHAAGGGIGIGTGAAGVESRMHVLAKRLRKDNVAQLAVLTIKAPTPEPAAGAQAQPPPPPQQLLIVNTHLHWDSARADVKLWQCQCLVREIERLLASLAAPSAGRSAASGAGHAAGSASVSGSLAAVLQVCSVRGWGSDKRHA